MPDNRSLDEFLAGDSEGDEPEDAPAEPAEGTPASDEAAPEPEEATPEPDAEAAEDEPVEPMAVTVVWSADGGVCEACGSSVEERWRDGDAMVCGDCKAW